MKSGMLVCLAILLSALSFGQKIDGRYYGGSDNIFFNPGKNVDSVYFSIKSDRSGIIGDFYGSGTYKILDKYLIIHTGEYHGKKSTYKKTKRDQEFVIITVLDFEGNPLIGANIEIMDTSGNIILGKVSDINGRTFIDKNQTADKLVVSYFRESYAINFSEKYDYHVQLRTFKVIEDKTVVFKINSLEKEAMNVTLLTTNLEGDNDKPISMEMLKTLETQHSYRERVLVKQ